MIVEFTQNFTLIATTRLFIVSSTSTMNIHQSCKRLVLDYKKTNENIKKSIDTVNLEAMFANKSAHDQVNIFNWDSLHVRLQASTARHEVTRKQHTKRLKHTENVFRNKLQMKNVCKF